MRIERCGEGGYGMPDPDRSEIYRYLGCGREPPGGQVRAAVERCVGELRAVSKPCALLEDYELRLPGDGRICFGGLLVRSRSLEKNLAGCGHVTVMAATLGVGPDRLIARASVGRVSDMVIFQAAAAAMIEAFCDMICGGLRREAEAAGSVLRPRFSPGYGDFPLEFQADLFRALDIPKRIGVTLTESFLMVPSKSVTALIGRAERRGEGMGTPEEPAAGTAAAEPGRDGGAAPKTGCGGCGMRNCSYRAAAAPKERLV